MPTTRKRMWKVSAGIALSIAILCLLVSVGFYRDVYAVGKGASYLMMADSWHFAGTNEFQLEVWAAMDGTRKAALTTLGGPIGISALLILLVAQLTPGIPKRVRFGVKIAFGVVAFLSMLFLAIGYRQANIQQPGPEALGYSAVLYALILCVLRLIYKLGKRFVSRIEIEEETSVTRIQVEGINWNRGALRIWSMFTVLWGGYFALQGVGCLLSNSHSVDAFHDLESAYTYGPTVPILLLGLWFIGRWILNGFKQSK